MPMSRYLLVLLMLLMPVVGFPQQQPSQPLVDFSSRTLRLPNSPTLPSTCSVGQIYFDNDATAGFNIYGCTATNTWTAMRGTSSGTVTSIATTSPITGGTITSTGTIACATCAVTGSPLSQFASTTSAQFSGVISDETGTGVVVLATSPTLVTPVLGVASVTSLTFSTGTQTLLADATDTLAIRRGVNSQSFNIYETYTDASNYARFNLFMDTSYVYLRSQYSGTGDALGLAFGTNNIARWLIPATSGHLLAVADNTYDIGASGATRPRTGYFGTSVIVPTVQGTSTLQAGTQASQYAAAVTARNTQNAFEWGHSNTGGYGSTLGFESSSGSPFLCMSCGHGTNSSTYKTFGLLGTVVKGDAAGGLLIGVIPTASADNQSPTTMLYVTPTSTRVAAHLESTGSVPSIGGSCGTSPSIVGTDVAGKVTTGSVAPTSCTVTFAIVWTNAPACFSVNETTANLSRAVSTTTTVTLSGTMVAGDVLAYHCIGRL